MAKELASIMIVLTIIGLFLTYQYYNGAFKHTNIIGAAHFENKKMCQQKIFLGYSVGSVPFTLMFSNIGERNTALRVHVDSDILQFEEKDIGWQALINQAAERPTTYEFKILNNRTLINNINNFTISYYYDYDDQDIFNQPKVVQSSKTYCTYSKDISNDFVLIKIQ